MTGDKSFFAYGSTTLRVVRALADAGYPMYSSVIATKTGLDAKVVTRVLDRLRNRGLISREKAKSPFRYYRWHMTDEQLFAWRRTSTTDTLDQGDTEKKIDFLMLVRRNPMYSDSPALRQIIADYKFLSCGDSFESQ